MLQAGAEDMLVLPPQLVAQLPQDRQSLGGQLRSGGASGWRGTEIDHIDATGHDHVRNAAAACRGEAVLARAEHSAAKLVGPFGRRDVQAGIDEAFFDKRLHRAAADAGGVKCENFEFGRFQQSATFVDACRRVAKHARGYDRTRGRF